MLLNQILEGSVIDLNKARQARDELEQQKRDDARDEHFANVVYDHASHLTDGWTQPQLRCYLELQQLAKWFHSLEHAPVKIPGVKNLYNLRRSFQKNYKMYKVTTEHGKNNFYTNEVKDNLAEWFKNLHPIHRPKVLMYINYVPAIESVGTRMWNALEVFETKWQQVINSDSLPEELQVRLQFATDTASRYTDLANALHEIKDINDHQ